MDVLVVDVGGTFVKLWHTAHQEHRKFPSGRTLTPEEMVERTRESATGWTWEAIALGLPSRVSNGRPVEDPPNLGPGWLGFNFASAMDAPVRIMNDAALQALGSYDGGRMLFFGLGTAVGSAYIAEGAIVPLDLGRLHYGKERLANLLGDAGFEQLGLKKWQAILFDIVPPLRSALLADYVVLGGGSVEKLETLPDAVRRGHNRAVVEGGRRLWEELPDPTHPSMHGWTVL